MFKKIINTCLLAFTGLLLSFYQAPDAFKSKQYKSQRVKTAYEKKWPALRELLKTKGVNENDFDLYLRTFKNEGVLEVFVKNTSEKQFQLLKIMQICAKSGDMGPKRKQGDGQVPEGFYEISAFNPYSNYHMSLKVSYPNKSDLIKSGRQDPGGDIMIHGNCVTIGCIPLQNDPVEEVYVLCVEAKNRRRIIRTDIYPFRFSEKNIDLQQQNKDPELRRFWNSLKTACDYFESSRSLPQITTDKNGNYTINPGSR